MALIITPEEAEVIIPVFRTAKWPVTHLLVYAAPVTKSMLHFDSLNYYSLPSLLRDWKPPQWLTIELGLFSGRLYFGIEEYAALLGYLEQGYQSKIDKETSQVDTGESTKSIQKNVNLTFTANEPLNFLQDWLALRRKGQDISYTPMGYVCQSRQIPSNHPFFSSTNANAAESIDPASTTSKDDAIAKGEPSLNYRKALMTGIPVGSAHPDEEYSGESEDDFNDADADNIGDVEFDGENNRFVDGEDVSSESSL